MKPVYKALIDDYPDLNIKVVDYDSNMNACVDAGIRGLPTIKLYKDGKESEKYNGGRDTASLKSFFDRETKAYKDSQSANTGGNTTNTGGDSANTGGDGTCTDGTCNGGTCTDGTCNGGTCTDGTCTDGTCTGPECNLEVQELPNGTTITRDSGTGVVTQDLPNGTLVKFTPTDTVMTRLADSTVINVKAGAVDVKYPNACANGSCADGTCTDGTCTDGTCTDGSCTGCTCTDCTCTGGDGTCTDGTCSGGTCTDGTCTGGDTANTGGDETSSGGDATPADPYLKTHDDHKNAISATASGGKPLIVAYTATWCGPCKTMKPVYKALIDDYPDLNIKVVDYD
jgi:hypothetical protein